MGIIRNYFKDREPRNIRINGTGAVNEWKKLADAHLGECPSCKKIVTFKLMRACYKFTHTWIPILRWHKKYYIVCPDCGESRNEGWEISAEEAKKIIEMHKKNKEK